MSSSNEVDVIYAEETVTYGVVEAGAVFETMRKTDETLSATPTTVISDEARADRQSGGQAAVGLAVGGDVIWQLSRGKAFDDHLQAAMYSTWTTPPAPATEVAAALAVTNGVGTIDRVTGDWTTALAVNDFAIISSAANAVNNTVIFITALTSDIISFVGPATMVANASDTFTLTALSALTIGTTRRSFGMEKKFKDIVQNISYSGMRSSGFTLDASVNKIVSGSFKFMGSQTEQSSVSIANGHTLNAADASPLINAQLDMGFISIDGVIVQYTIESIGVDLNNNVKPEEGVGFVGAKNQIPFEAAVGIKMTAHLSGANIALIQKKKTQAPISMTFFLRDVNGDGYAFHVPEAQLSFPDPNMGGKNNHVMLTMSGVARYSASLGNTMKIARIGAV